MRITSSILATGIVALLSSTAFAGGHNKTFVYQAGKDSTAVIKQLGSNAKFGKYNQRFNAGNANADSNRLDVEQKGNKNRIAASGAAVSYQYGVANRMTLKQNSGNKNSIDRVRQAGKHNNMVINQEGDNNIIANAYQTGNSSAANKGQLHILQRGDWNIIGNALQNGTSNDMYLTQHSDHHFIGSAQQNGKRNSMRITQHPGHQAVLEARQSGNDNEMRIEQQGLYHALIGFASQSGTANKMSITQWGNGSYVGEATQSGSNNEMTIWQSGGGNSIELARQTGDNGLVWIKQYGSTYLNSVRVSQSGNWNKLWVHQKSSHNVADIVQTGRNVQMTIIQE